MGRRVCRYSSKLYTTLDNVDVRYNTYQGFSEWFVMDTHLNYKVDSHWSASLGVDNLFDAAYEQEYGYPRVGRTVYGGVEIHW